MFSTYGLKHGFDKDGELCMYMMLLMCLSGRHSARTPMESPCTGSIAECGCDSEKFFVKKDKTKD